MCCTIPRIMADSLTAKEDQRTVLLVCPLTREKGSNNFLLENRRQEASHHSMRHTTSGMTPAPLILHFLHLDTSRPNFSYSISTKSLDLTQIWNIPDTFFHILLLPLTFLRHRRSIIGPEVRMEFNLGLFPLTLQLSADPFTPSSLFHLSPLQFRLSVSRLLRFQSQKNSTRGGSQRFGRTQRNCIRKQVLRVELQ